MEREIQLEEAEHAKDVVIDVGLLNSMKEKLASTCAKSSPSFTICRVPEIIRHSDRAAYDPRIISIGPFHRGRKNLTAVEEHKWRYLQKVLSRSKPENDLEKYLKEMKAKEAQARNCYSENITIGSNEFVEMMVLDGCFVLQLIHEHNHNYFDKNDPIHRNDWMSGRIFHDMLLLENQLPFFVLECLWELIGQPRTTLRKEALTFFRPAFPTEVELKCPEEPDHIHHLLHAVHLSLRPKPQSMSTATGKLSCLQHCKGMGKILPFLRCLVETRDMSTPTSQQSLLEDNPPCLVETRDTSTPTGQQSSLEYNPPCLVETRDTSTPPSQQSLLGASPPCLVETSTPPSQQSLLGASPPCLVETSTPTGQQSSLPPSMVRTIIPCARELQEAGLRFQRKQARSFIDVTFEKGWMEMPYLLITDDTNALFRNFIAFEQCFPECGSDFTTYCFLMDALVNTPRDVSILSQSNIIEHMLGSDKEVALLFNKLCKEIVLDPKRSYLANVFEKVNRYTQENWPKWRAKLVRDYFSNPWLTNYFSDKEGGLPMYVATRGLYNIKPPTVFVPPCIKSDVEKLFDVHRAMSRVELNLDLVALDVGETYEIRNDLVVRPFKTHHVIPSQGYVIYSVRKKLKKKYLHLKGPQIKKLKLSGVEITDTILSPEVAFTGDTTSDFILDPRNADALRAKVLITEATFLDEEMGIEHARQHGHMHLFEILENAQWIRNESIILTHFSSQYKIEDIREAVSKLQRQVRGKVLALTEGFKSTYT